VATSLGVLFGFMALGLIFIECGLPCFHIAISSLAGFATWLLPWACFLGAPIYCSHSYAIAIWIMHHATLEDC
jgi:hypothetical protein